MADNVISYIEMCAAERARVFRPNMNFGLGGNHSVVLMSVRANAPYRDRLEDGGTTLIYEGMMSHAAPESPRRNAEPWRHPRNGAPVVSPRVQRAAS